MGLLSGFCLWSRFLQISPIYKGNLAGRASSPEHFLQAPPLPAPQGSLAIPSIVSGALRDFLIKVNFLLG